MTTETKTYNGWTNYETWCVNLWLTNESDSAQELDRIVHDHIINRMIGNVDVALSMKSDMLKSWVRGEDEESYPSDFLQGNGMFVDLLNGALDLVNWREIIENHLDD